MGPPRTLTGTAEHKIWYDATTYTRDETDRQGGFALAEENPIPLSFVAMVYKARPPGEERSRRQSPVGC